MDQWCLLCIIDSRCVVVWFGLVFWNTVQDVETGMDCVVFVCVCIVCVCKGEFK